MNSSYNSCFIEHLVQSFIRDLRYSLRRFNMSRLSDIINMPRNYPKFFKKFCILVFYRTLPRLSFSHILARRLHQCWFPSSLHWSSLRYHELGSPRGTRKSSRSGLLQWKLHQEFKLSATSRVLALCLLETSSKRCPSSFSVMVAGRLQLWGRVLGSTREALQGTSKETKPKQHS